MCSARKYHEHQQVYGHDTRHPTLLLSIYLILYETRFYGIDDFTEKLPFFTGPLIYTERQTLRKRQFRKQVSFLQFFEHNFSCPQSHVGTVVGIL